MTNTSSWNVRKLSFNISHLVLTPDLLIRAQKDLECYHFWVWLANVLIRSMRTGLRIQNSSGNLQWTGEGIVGCVTRAQDWWYRSENILKRCVGRIHEMNSMWGKKCRNNINNNSSQWFLSSYYMVSIVLCTYLNYEIIPGVLSTHVFQMVVQGLEMFGKFPRVKEAINYRDGTGMQLTHLSLFAWNFPNSITKSHLFQGLPCHINWHPQLLDSKT